MVSHINYEILYNNIDYFPPPGCRVPNTELINLLELHVKFHIFRCLFIWGI